MSVSFFSSCLFVEKIDAWQGAETLQVRWMIGQSGDFIL